MKINILRKSIAKLFLILLFPFLAQAQSSDSTLILDKLIQKAVAENPELQSSYQGWKSSETRIPQAEALPDPTLGLNLMNLPVNSLSFDQEPMTGKQITLMQKIPYPGNLSLKGKIARSDADITYQQHRELRNQLIRDAKQAYYDLFYIDRAIATVANNRKRLKEFVEIAETRYSVGDGLQQDVLRAQVALSKLIDRELKLQQQKEALHARINTLLNEPADAPLGKPVVPELKEWTAELHSLVQKADSTNPMLAAWKTVVDRSRQQSDLARKGRYPEFSVGVAYTQRDRLQNGMKGYDFVSAMFNISIPLYHGKKQDKKVQESRINRVSMEYRYQNVENAVEQRLQQSLADLRKNRKLIDLYETGVIPQAEESLESSLAGYQNGKVDFLSLLDSELTLFNLRLDYYRYLADYHKSVADLEALTGSEF